MQIHRSDWPERTSPRRVMAVCCTLGFLIASFVGGRWLSAQAYAPTVPQGVGVTLAFGFFGLLVGSIAADGVIEARSRR